MADIRQKLLFLCTNRRIDRPIMTAPVNEAKKPLFFKGLLHFVQIQTVLIRQVFPLERSAFRLKLH